MSTHMKRWGSHVNRSLSSTRKYLKGSVSTNASQSTPKRKNVPQIFMQRIKQNARRKTFGQIFYSEAFFVRAAGFFLGVGASSVSSPTTTGFFLAVVGFPAVLETLFARGVTGSSATISADSST